MMGKVLDTPMGIMSFSGDSGFRVAPARITDMTPRAYRLASYPDGSVRLQGMYAWTQGNEGGVFWEDVPIVSVDDSGKEINGT